jgi:hypothetical protein
VAGPAGSSSTGLRQSPTRLRPIGSSPRGQPACSGQLSSTLASERLDGHRSKLAATGSEERHPSWVRRSRVTGRSRVEREHRHDLPTRHRVRDVRERCLQRSGTMPVGNPSSLGRLRGGPLCHTHRRQSACLPAHLPLPVGLVGVRGQEAAPVMIGRAPWSCRAPRQDYPGIPSRGNPAKHRVMTGI